MKPLNLQKFVSTKFELIAILLLQLATLHAQIDNDVNTSKIAKNQDGHGVYSNYLTANIQHPITTFSSEYSVSEIQQILVLKVRKIPNKTRFFSQAISDVYSGIYNGALAYANGTSQLYLPDDYDEPEQIDPNAEAAKQAAFVCLLGLDKDGNEIKSGSPLYHQFKQVAFNVLTMLKDNDYNKVYGGSDGKGYNTSRRVILFLQAYDFLKGLEPQNDTVIQIGYLLQSHVRDFFRINKNWPWDVFYRNDNHTLLHAGVIGLASVVLHNHSHKSIDKSWHPEQWAHAAFW